LIKKKKKLKKKKFKKKKLKTEIQEKEIEEKEIGENELIREKELIEAPANKPRGRPKGSTKPKKEPPPPPEKPKKVAKAKPQKKVVHYQSESSDEEPLPEYVRQQLPERDLASQMMQLLQQHSNKTADARKQMYSSWFSRF
jgi:hypothetical protein